ncbi:nucleotide-diphospho-sugar transferase [Xylariaceae sp. FL0016]|nr:nucleotide-diphospho-sugar transferase [Xylariaceae sp. FL0016]
MTNSDSVEMGIVTKYIQALFRRENALFLVLLVLRYLRLIVNITGWLIYTPSPIPARPTLRRADCTVVVPTVDPRGAGFLECVQSILRNQAGVLIIITVGRAREADARNQIKAFRARYPGTTIITTSIDEANKRKQVAAGLGLVQTSIVVLADDSVTWPSLNFLPSAIAPFEDPRTGAVATNKHVRRFYTPINSLRSLRTSFFGFLGCTYLARHNFEIRATNAIDGGVFVISGRTALYRSAILKDPRFLKRYLDEHFLFGRFGPMNVDDNNFLTRWVVRNGWNIKVQYTPDSEIETVVGEYPRFLQQLQRWTRTTWRSNSASLFTDRTVWLRQPWCVYAVYLTSLVNFALFYDASLLLTLYYTTTFGHSGYALALMAMFSLGSKTIKLITHFVRHPRDVFFFPLYVGFTYYHTFVKLYALCTFYDHRWTGRNLDAVQKSVKD